MYKGEPVDIDLKHIKVTERIEHADGTADTTYESYREGLSTRIVTKEKSHPTSQATLYRDLLTCATIIKDTEELTLKIVKKHGEPFRIIQSYEVSRERYEK